MRHVKFKEVELMNFRCHQEMNFSFEENKFVIITGNNGSGKTSILDSVSWALFDKTTKGRTGDAVIRKRSGKNTSVIFTFSINSNEYKIENYRKHTQNKDKKLLYKDGVLISDDRDRINTIIEEILLPYDVFMNCIMFSQYLDKPFAEQTDAKKKSLFDKMLGFEIYETHREKFKDSVTQDNSKLIELDSKQKMIENNLNFISEQVETERKNERDISEQHSRNVIALKNLIDELKKELEDINSKIEIYNAKIDEKEYQDLIRKRSEFEVLINNEGERLKKEIADITKTISDKKESLISSSISGNINEKNTVDAKILAAQNKLTELKSSTEIEKQKLVNTINSKITAETTRYSDIVTPLADKKKIEETNLTKCVFEKTSIENQIDTLDKEIATSKTNLNKEIPVCYTCGQKIQGEAYTKIETELKNKEKSKDMLLTNLKKIDKSVGVITKNIQDLNSQIEIEKKENTNNLQDIESFKKKEISDLQTKYNTSKEKIISEKTSLEEKLDNINEKISDVVSDIDQKIKNELSEEIEKLNIASLKKIEKTNKLLTTVNTSISVAEENINARNKLTSDIQVINTKIDLKTKEVEKADKDNTSALVKSIQTINTLTEKLDKIATDRNEIIESQTGVNKIIKIKEFWKKAFSGTGIKAVLLDEAIPIINEKAAELSKYTDTINVRFSSTDLIKSGEKRNKFAVNTIQTKNLTDDRVDFSGGEGRLTDIITLLSLRHLLETMHQIKFNVLLFDEVLDSLDPKNVDVVINMLRTVSSNYCLLLITHTLRSQIEADEIFPM